MKLLQRASAAVKDKKSIYLAKVGRKKGFRNPDLEAAVIKATSHDESFIDYKNAQRVFDWVRSSPAFLKPLIWALTNRLDKTHNWVVALKSLMLLHGVFSTHIPATRMIGRLPFDLSAFHDRSSGPTKSSGYSVFIQAYFAFLDLHSTFLSYYREEEQQQEDEESQTMMKKSLLRLHRSQELLDLLLQIKPCTDGMEVGLVLEAMDCIVLEIFDVYNEIYDDVTSVVGMLASEATPEAVEALEILQKVAVQGSKVEGSLKVCREMGIENARELPPIRRIREEDLCEVERRIVGNKDVGGVVEEKGETGEEAGMKMEQHKGGDKWKEELRNVFGTTVTENWVVFDDELPVLWI
ncbi:hypothetical protein MRB53_001436 [Persea americana]|uniref:Uncharacterized protein n=1 Tax=Persea americana TaxID=3435 RepID=A0ACC2MRZ6_PERAE|nr:hypothetical protein MRB53_001436 [Persea americana]